MLFLNTNIEEDNNFNSLLSQVRNNIETALYVSSINQENEKITKIYWKIGSYKILEKLMAAEIPSVVLFLRLN